MVDSKLKESDLYLPVKTLLEEQGYQVKGEIKNCDVLAKRDNLVIAVELKLILNLKLLMQANERSESVDFVYIAIPKTNSFYSKHRRSLLKLLRKIGFGLIVVTKTFKKADVMLDPTPYMPRKAKKKRGHLLKEFVELVGDPNLGGSSTRKKRMTLYRQRAVQIAMHLQKVGECKASHVRDALEIENARDMMYKNVYGWFEGKGKGIYMLSKRGARELEDWKKRIGVK